MGNAFLTLDSENIQQANKMFQQDKLLFHPKWKIKNEMFVKKEAKQEEE